MHLLGQRTLGIVILALLGALVVVKRVASGSLVEKPRGPFLLAAVNGFNLLFLLVVNPLAGVLLIARRLEAADATHVSVEAPLVTVVETIGLALYASGLALMAWALIVLGRSYQLGGSAPRPDDRIVVAGPYALVRHPMYTAALAIALGLACLTQSAACLAVFGTYLVLILLLVPVEEAGLQEAYRERYVAYRRKTGALLPSIFRPG